MSKVRRFYAEARECEACGKVQAYEAANPALLRKHGLTSFGQLAIAYLCQDCKYDIVLEGGRNGHGWRWLQARKETA